jgi:serine/threonine protein kinase
MNNFRLEPGTVLAEKYRLETVLGTGGMGTVYQAEHLALKALVAVKVIDREVDEGDVALARFMREAQSAASLRSPHVVQILDYGMEGKRPFMVMEMLEGEPLANRIKRLGRLSPQETFRVISHVSRAVSKAHEADIIHRDLKPDNVFLVHNEGDEIAKVLDFGVAKVESTQLDGEGHTRTGSLLGTPYYMSPEQAQGNKDRDPLPRWTEGRASLLGDAAHAMYPIGSNGASQAILDARVLTREILTRGTTPAALAAYEEERRPATAEIVLANRRNGPEQVMQRVEEQAPDGFARIEDVLAPGELAETATGYKKLAGFDRDALNSRPSIVPPIVPPPRETP